MEEDHAGAPTRVFPRIKNYRDARDRFWKEYGGGSACLSDQSQAGGRLEKRVASQRRAGVSWQGVAAAGETRCGTNRRTGTQDRTAGDGDRVSKKNLTA